MDVLEKVGWGILVFLSHSKKTKEHEKARNSR